jgi:putative endopeptidase
MSPSEHAWVFAALSVLPLAAFGQVACGGAAPPPPEPVVAPPPPATAPVATVASPPKPSLDEAMLDRSVAPCDDFYQHACGGWLASTPIPGDKSGWSRGFSVLAEQNAATTRDILERAADGRGDADNPYAKAMGDFYASCMDESGIEARGLGELREELGRVARVKDAASLAKELAHQHVLGVNPAFVLDSETDQKDPRLVVGSLRQAGLSLPDREYYVDDGAKMKDLRAKLEAHVEAMLVLVGEAPREAKAHAATVLRVETLLARPQMNVVDQRDPDKIYHRLDRAGLPAAAPLFPWDAYFAELGYPKASAINVWQPDYVKAVGEMVRSIPMADWRTYLRWTLVNDAAPTLGHALVDEDFRFRQALTGAKTLEPRWRRCVRLVDAGMGEALGRSFAKTALGADGKATVEGMVDGLLAAMQADVEHLGWMDEPTRAKAKAKLATFAKKIGYPDRWRSYDALRVERGDYLGNVWRAQAFEARRQRDKIGLPVDRSEWGMTPPTVNAQYSPDFNDITFPAGILQPPFFGRAMPRPMTFGGIGMVMGHEVTHGFDDEGRKFDADGSRRDWWTTAAAAEFEKRASCVVEQFDGYAPFPDKHIDGKLTLGENLADLGGLEIALAAFRQAQKEHPSDERYGYSDDQLFFYGYAHSWCSSIREERQRTLLTVDPHSPPRYRVDGPLSNMPEFAAAFRCAAGSKMVRAPRCEVW